MVALQPTIQIIRPALNQDMQIVIPVATSHMVRFEVRSDAISSGKQQLVAGKVSIEKILSGVKVTYLCVRVRSGNRETDFGGEVDQKNLQSMKIQQGYFQSHNQTEVGFEFMFGGRSAKTVFSVEETQFILEIFVQVEVEEKNIGAADPDHLMSGILVRIKTENLINWHNLLMNEVGISLVSGVETSIRIEGENIPKIGRLVIDGCRNGTFIMLQDNGAVTQKVNNIGAPQELTPFVTPSVEFPIRLVITCQGPGMLWKLQETKLLDPQEDTIISFIVPRGRQFCIYELIPRQSSAETYRLVRGITSRGMENVITICENGKSIGSFPESVDRIRNFSYCINASRSESPREDESEASSRALFATLMIRPVKAIQNIVAKDLTNLTQLAPGETKYFIFNMQESKSSLPGGKEKEEDEPEEESKHFLFFQATGADYLVTVFPVKHELWTPLATIKIQDGQVEQLNLNFNDLMAHFCVATSDVCQLKFSATRLKARDSYTIFNSGTPTLYFGTLRNNRCMLAMNEVMPLLLSANVSHHYTITVDQLKMAVYGILIQTLIGDANYSLSVILYSDSWNKAPILYRNKVSAKQINDENNGHYLLISPVEFYSMHFQSSSKATQLHLEIKLLCTDNSNTLKDDQTGLDIDTDACRGSASSGMLLARYAVKHKSRTESNDLIWTSRLFDTRLSINLNHSNYYVYTQNDFKFCVRIDLFDESNLIMMPHSKVDCSLSGYAFNRLDYPSATSRLILTISPTEDAVWVASIDVTVTNVKLKQKYFNIQHHLLRLEDYIPTEIMILAVCQGERNETDMKDLLYEYTTELEDKDHHGIENFLYGKPVNETRAGSLQNMTEYYQARFAAAAEFRMTDMPSYPKTILIKTPRNFSCDLSVFNPNTIDNNYTFIAAPGEYVYFPRSASARRLDLVMSMVLPSSKLLVEFRMRNDFWVSCLRIEFSGTTSTVSTATIDRAESIDSESQQIISRWKIDTSLPANGEQASLRGFTLIFSKNCTTSFSYQVLEEHDFSYRLGDRPLKLKVPIQNSNRVNVNLLMPSSRISYDQIVCKLTPSTVYQNMSDVEPRFEVLNGVRISCSDSSSNYTPVVRMSYSGETFFSPKESSDLMSSDIKIGLDFRRSSTNYLSCFDKREMHDLVIDQSIKLFNASSDFYTRNGQVHTEYTPVFETLPIDSKTMYYGVEESDMTMAIDFFSTDYATNHTKCVLRSYAKRSPATGLTLGEQILSRLQKTSKITHESNYAPGLVTFAYTLEDGIPQDLETLNGRLQRLTLIMHLIVTPVANCSVSSHQAIDKVFEPYETYTSSSFLDKSTFQNLELFLSQEITDDMPNSMRLISVLEIEVIYEQFGRYVKYRDTLSYDAEIYGKSALERNVNFLSILARHWYGLLACFICFCLTFLYARSHNAIIARLNHPEEVPPVDEFLDLPEDIVNEFLREGQDPQLRVQNVNIPELDGNEIELVRQDDPEVQPLGRGQAPMRRIQPFNPGMQPNPHNEENEE